MKKELQIFVQEWTKRGFTVVFNNKGFKVARVGK